MLKLLNRPLHTCADYLLFEILKIQVLRLLLFVS